MQHAAWIWGLAATALMLGATGVGAQDDRASRRDRPAAQANSDNPVKRTWDFTKRWGLINLGGRGGCGAEAEEAQTRIDIASRMLADFLAGPVDAKKLGLERKKYLGQVLGAERSIDAYLEGFRTAGQRSPDSWVPPIEQDICMAKGQKISMVALYDGLAGIAELYPDMTEVAPVLARAKAALQTMGDDGAIAAMVRANRDGALAAVRLKPALSNNPDWIAGFRKAFAALVPGETILKVHPYSADWYIHRNALTSYPEYRQIGAWVAARRPDGTCWIHSIDLWQNYTGSGFDNGTYKPGGAPQQVLCENL
jgi:hypothetical protein